MIANDIKAVGVRVGDLENLEWWFGTRKADTKLLGERRRRRRKRRRDSIPKGVLLSTDNGYIAKINLITYN
jgi:hypothetical protein